MNAKTTGTIAILLWILTAGFIGFRMMKGSTETAADGRQAVVMTHAERTLVLTEMRQLLQSVQGVIQGIEKNDMAMVAEHAKAGGTGMMADLNPSLMMKLPMEFKQKGVAVHKEFDKIAGAAEAGKNKEQILKMMSAQLSACVACHSIYQIRGE